jgi:hypothetical protein
MNPMNTYDAFAPTIDHNGGIEVTPDELAAIADVLDAAQAWQDGTLPLSAFARVGILKPRVWSDDKRGIVCRGNDHAGYTRWRSLIWAKKERDPRLAALQAALVALRAVEGMVTA